MSHLKRHAVPKAWPVPRKGTTFVVKKASRGIPILVVLRDMLKIAQNRKEVKKAIHMKHLMISNKVVNDEKKSLELFDVLTIVPSKKNYRIILSDKGKYDLEEISENDAKVKVAKVVDKKQMKDKKVQFNLWDGRNYISDIDCKVNDSVVIDLEKGKVTKCVPLKEKANALVIGGKHTGQTGVIEKIKPELKMAELKTKDDKFNVLINQLMVVQ